MSTTNPRVETLEPQHTLAVRHVIPMSELDLGALYGSTFPRLFGALAERDLKPAGPPFGRYHEWGQRVDVEIGVPVAEGVPGLQSSGEPGELIASHLPGGRAATLTHLGPYDGLPDANATLSRWIAEQGLERASGLWESYVDDPGAVADVSELRTDIIQPITDA